MLKILLRVLLLVVSFGVELARGQVSIPTCCHFDTAAGSAGYKCKNGRPEKGEPGQRFPVPRSVPVDMVHRLGLTNLGNNIQWVEKDVKCKGTKPMSRSISTEPKLFEFQSDGYLMIWNELNGTADYFHVEQYCINEVSVSKIEIKSCEVDCTGTEPCLRLCCPLGTVVSFPSQTDPDQPKCRPQKWYPLLYKNPAKPKSVFSEKELRALQPRYFLRPPPTWYVNCHITNTTHPLVNSEKVLETLILDLPPSLAGDAVQFNGFRLDSHGFPHYRSPRRKWDRLVDEHHCVSGLFGKQEVDPTVAVVFVCSDRNNLEEMREHQVSEFYGPLAILTSLFALVTLIAYALVFEKQNIHGWTQMSHSGAVFLMFIFLGVAHLTKEDNEVHVSRGCLVIATATHYFFIAAFTWFFILSLDLWLTFRTVSAPLGRGGRRHKRFISYSIGGWGVPLIVVSVSWFLEVRYRSDPDTEIPVPLYGDLFCYVTRHALWEFVYGPVSILLILNLVLFVCTSVTLYKFQQSTKIAMQNINQERQSFGLFLKLFLICGVLWITELLSFTFSGAHITWYIQIFDSVNILQPVAIFFIFIFKWEMINSLHEKYVALRPILYPARLILLKFRQRQNRQFEGIAIYSKANETHVSRVSTADLSN